jgi:hypothetical protein
VGHTVNGSKITKVYDPTQREEDNIDPDVEAEILGLNRDIPGPVVFCDVTWTGPSGESQIVHVLKVPVQATVQDLAFRLSLALKKQEMDYTHLAIAPDDWSYAKILRVVFFYEPPNYIACMKYREMYYSPKPTPASSFRFSWRQTEHVPEIRRKDHLEDGVR